MRELVLDSLPPGNRLDSAALLLTSRLGRLERAEAVDERLEAIVSLLGFLRTDVPTVSELLVASAALFYRESAEGPLRRELSTGWEDQHTSSVPPERLLVRYLQAEHAALRLEDEQQWLPPGVPEGVEHPVLAIPVVSQHMLNAVVLYGAHTNSTLPDPDEVVLLTKLADAAAVSHQQLRIATLARQNDAQRTRIAELEASLRALGR